MAEEKIDVDYKMELIYLYFEQDKYDDVIFHAEELLGYEPENTTALLYYAMALYNDQQLEEAHAIGLQLYSMNYRRPVIFQMFARYYIMFGQIKEAEEALLEGLALYPEEAFLFIEYSELLLANGEFKWGLEAFYRAEEIDPFEEIVVEHKLKLLEVGFVEIENIETIKAVYTEVGFTNSLIERYANVCLKKKMYKEARESYEAIENFDPKNRAYRQNYFDCHYVRRPFMKILEDFISYKTFCNLICISLLMWIFSNYFPNVEILKDWPKILIGYFILIGLLLLMMVLPWKINYKRVGDL
ncbi:MAG: tetratricopeptide repeat protein [Bacilli bacterium]